MANKGCFIFYETAKVAVLMPLILALKIRLKGRDEELQKCLNLIEILILANWVCGRPSEGFNKVVPVLVRKLNAENCRNVLKAELKEKLPTENEIEESFRDLNRRNNRAKLVLFWIELYREYQNRDYKDRSGGLEYEYQLEHLMPQKWQEHWREIGKDEENAKNLIEQIGNMTLLKKGLNNTISNREWRVKLHGEGRHAGIKFYADLSINKELINEAEWDEWSITHRTKRLTKEFLEIWNVKIFDSV